MFQHNKNTKNDGTMQTERTINNFNLFKTDIIKGELIRINFKAQMNKYETIKFYNQVLSF